MSLQCFLDLLIKPISLNHNINFFVFQFAASVLSNGNNIVHQHEMTI